MNMQLRALRRRDWLQQYANYKIMQKFAKVCKRFCKLLQILEHLFYFILFYMYEQRYATKTD